MAGYLIRGATVHDGTGGRPQRAEVATDGERITDIGPRLERDGRTVVDADGLILAPGFIDLHSHADFTIGGDPAAETQVTQGVTTLVTGNCGHSPFPVADPADLAATTSFIGGDLPWTWTDLRGYRTYLHQQAPAVNVAQQLGHGAVRLAVMGTADRGPTTEELKRMCDLVRAAADQGAVGFSTGLIYAPGSYATTEEVEALVATAAACGLTYSTHVRNESHGVLAAIDEAIGIARRAGARLQISHIKAMGRANHGRVGQILERIDAAVADGVDVTADVYPYTASSTTLTSRLPDWALGGGTSALLERLADRPTRERVLRELAARFAGEFDPDGIVLAALPTGPYTPYVGRSIGDIARDERIEPAAAALAVLDAHRAAVAVVNHAMAEPDLEAALRHPLVAVASDGWVMTATGPGNPHPRSFGTFTRVLGRYVRERPVLSLEEAVRKMTSLPASRMALGQRGVIRRGAVADLVAFDPETVTDRSTYDRPWQLSTGIKHLIVGGRVVVEHGRSSVDRHGQVV